MRLGKFVCVLVVCVLGLSVVGVFVPVSMVGASLYTSYGVEHSANGFAILKVHDGVSGNSAMGEVINVTASMLLNGIQMHLWKYGSPVGTLRMKIEGATAGVQGVPNGTVVATSSNAIQIASLTTSGTLQFFEFSGVTLAVGYYAFYVYVDAATVLDDATNFVRVGYDGSGSASYSTGNLFQFAGAWGGNTQQNDVVFYVYSSASESPVPVVTGSFISDPAGVIVPHTYTGVNPSIAYYDNLTVNQNYDFAGFVSEEGVSNVNGSWNVYVTGSALALADVNFTAGNINIVALSMGVHNVTDGALLNSWGDGGTGFVETTYIEEAGLYYGYIINGTLSDSSVFELKFGVYVHNPVAGLYLNVGVNGGTFSGYNVLSQAPTMYYLNQGYPSEVSYSLWCFVVNNGSSVGSYNWTVAKTAVSLNTNVSMSGDYLNVSSSRLFGSNAFTYSMPYVLSSNPRLYQGYRVYITLDNGTSFVQTYSFGWLWDGVTEPVGTNVPYPSATPVGGGSIPDGGLPDPVDNALVYYILIFVIVGVPAILLAAMGSKDGWGEIGFLGGLVLGVGSAVVVKLLPMWYVAVLGLLLAVLAYRAFSGGK